MDLENKKMKKMNGNISGLEIQGLPVIRKSRRAYC